MKNIQESLQDDESVTNRIMDTHSEIQSENNFNPRITSKINVNNKEKENIKNDKNNDINFNDSINQNKHISNISIKMTSKGKNLTNSLENNGNLKNHSSKRRGKKMSSNYDHFEIPPSRKNTNHNQSNNLLNISLNLFQPQEEDRSILIDDNKNLNLFENENNKLILNLNEDNPICIDDRKEYDQQSINNEDLSGLNPQLKIIKEEYDTLKREYNKIKSYLEKNRSNDKSELKENEKLKKKIKKRLKQIKEIFKDKTLNKY